MTDPLRNDDHRDLRKIIGALASLSALPSLRMDEGLAPLVSGVLATLASALDLELVHARIDDPKGGIPLEAAYDAVSGKELLRHEVAPAELPSFASFPLPGLNGILHARGQRPGFPRALDLTVLEAAANQLALAVRLVHLRAANRSAEEKLATRLASEPPAASSKTAPPPKRPAPSAFGGIIAESRAMRDLLAEITLVAPTDATVLLQGESGTGKELLARAIHERSRRADRPFIKVNCGAIPREMFESEFFGHVRGAFTGAVRDRPGRFNLADRGTILLDEIGELPLEMQPKLLRVLQEGQFERVGDDTTRSVDLRVIAATNRDLAEQVRIGRFREDLFYRLSVFPLAVAPLRHRKEDILPLAHHFLQLCSMCHGIPVPLQLSDEQQELLLGYRWPGNVRELANIVERAVILGRGRELPFEQLLGRSTSERFSSSTPTTMPPTVLSEAQMRRRERDNLLAALKRTSGRIYGAAGAAALLGIKPSTLQSRLRAFGIHPREVS